MNHRNSAAHVPRRTEHAQRRLLIYGLLSTVISALVFLLILAVATPRTVSPDRVGSARTSRKYYTEAGLLPRNRRSPTFYADDVAVPASTPSPLQPPAGFARYTDPATGELRDFVLRGKEWAPSELQ